MIDTHCHLNDDKFGNEVEAEVKKFTDSGVISAICNGSDFNSSKRAIYLAEKYNSVWATVGLGYENDYFDLNELKPKLVDLIAHPKVVAIGECGLDKWDTMHPKTWQKQLDLFNYHIQLATETKLPLVVHCRNAFLEVYDHLQASNLSVQMHCFTGNWDWAKKFLDLNCYLSVGGIVTFKSSLDLREVVKQVPQDRLVIETDSPYISPEPLRGQRNSPSNLPLIAKYIADLRGVSIDELDQVTSANVSALFPKLSRA